MRKTKRFIRNIAKKLTIYVVVFVALINACFYCPMQVQAAESSITMDSFLRSCVLEVSGFILFNRDTYTTRNIIAPNNAFGGANTNNGLPTMASSTFELPFLIYLGNPSGVLSSVLDSEGLCTFSGSIDFSVQLRNTSGSSNYVTPTSVTAIGPDGSTLTGVSYSLSYSGGSNPIATLTVSTNFNDFTYSPSNYFYLSINVSCIASNNVSSIYQLVEVTPTRFAGYGTISSGPSSGSVYDITDGYDDSAGNQVSSDFESSVGSYNEAEDSIFTSSESALDGFSFFDWSGYTGIVTGVSFVSSLMVSIYNNFGGMSGIGIVLSVLFSVMFLAIVIGLYRYFK